MGSAFLATAAATTAAAATVGLVAAGVAAAAVVAAAVAKKADPIYQDTTTVTASGTGTTLVVTGRTCIANC